MASPSHRVSLLLAALTTACGAAASGESAALRNVPEWTLSAAPTLSVGSEDGDPDYQFHIVTSAAVLPDGRLVVADGGNGSLAFYDRAGRFDRRIGRKGKGPSEFDFLDWVAAVGDSVVAWDPNLLRLTVFGADGTLARTAAVDATGGTFPRVLGRLADGSFAVDPGQDLFAMMGAQPGVRRDSTSFVRFAPDGKPMGQLGRFPGSETFLCDRATGFGTLEVPFGARSFAVASAHGLYVADGATGEIAVHGPEGTRTRVMKSPHARWPVSAADVARYKEERLAVLPNDARRRDTEQALATVPFPATATSIAGLAVDPDGNAWVQAEPRPGAEKTRWAVLSPQGTVEAHVDVPTGLRVLEVGRDHLVGLWRDEMGVPSVRVYQVRRAAE